MILANGMTVKSDARIPEFKDGHKTERKWAHRKMYQTWRRFNVKRDRLMVKVGDMFYCHPNTYKLLKDQLK